MIEPKVRTGARVPLFDRLVDTEPESQKELQPLRALDKNGLKESVRRELGRLLNTRCPIPLAPPPAERTVINYGIPDFSSLSPHSSDHRNRLESQIRDAISNYEPRLADVKVMIEPAKPQDRSLVANVEAKLQLDTIREPVSFSIIVKREAGRE
jgi:type VI secretion system protein ImpF